MYPAPYGAAPRVRIADPMDPTPRMRDLIDMQAAPEHRPEPVAIAPAQGDAAVQRALHASRYDEISVVAPARALPPPWAGEDLSGATLPPCYHLESRLCIGGMGVVYRARHLILDRRCAVKIPLAPASSEERRRLRREARLGALIDHPAVARVYDCGQLADLRPFLVMELLPWPSLRQLLNEGAMAPARAANLLAQAADGLAALHELNIVHRDLKPSNLLVGPGDRVKLIDLGLSKRPGEPDDDEVSLPGLMLGTPDYMAPEQRRGVDVDVRSDQYALGCVLFEVLSGVRLSRGPSRPDGSGGVAVDHDEPPPLWRLRDVPEELLAVLHRMLADDPADRFPSIVDVAAALRACARAT